MKRIINALLELFFPSLCVGCGTRLHDFEKHLCLSCIESLPKTNYHNQEENRLEHYLAGKFPFQRASAFCYFYKTGCLQKIIHELKYKNNAELAVYMGRMYGNDIKGSNFLKDIDYLIPIPLHPKRQKKRGYNQAEEICKGLSEATGIPVCTKAIKRVINNPSQTKHSRTERWTNVAGIFASTNNIDLNNKKILIVDDVITTGSTIEAIVKSLSEYKNLNINIAAIGIAM